MSARQSAKVPAMLLVSALAASQAGFAAAVALLPVQDRSGDSQAAAALDRALRLELDRLGDLLGSERVRDSLRRLRLRNGDEATPGEVRRLRDELGADWLVTATLHDAERRLVPRVTVSARVYDGGDGALLWAGFQGSSGLDTRKLLGLGTIDEVEELLPVAVGRLFEDLFDRRGELSTPAARTRSTRGRTARLAIVPLSGVTSRRALANAETLTEAVRAATLAAGIDLVPRHCVDGVTRTLKIYSWGGVDEQLRRALRDACGAGAVLTGSVERYDIGGGELEPEPHVSVALRLLDTETGRILWTAASERRGWDRQGLLRLGRVHSRGALTERILRRLTEQLLLKEPSS